jgi:hypothetical protein
MRKYAHRAWTPTLIALAFILATSVFATFVSAATITYNYEGFTSIPGTAPTLAANNVIAVSAGATYVDSNMYMGGQYDGGGYNSNMSGTPGLNDGTFGPADKSYTGTCGVASGYSPTVTYTLNTSVNTAGYDISQVDVYTGWDAARTEPNVAVLYSTVANPSTFTAIGTLTQSDAEFIANSPGGATYPYYTLDSQISGLNLTGVAAIRFAFGATQQFGCTMYHELSASGTPTPTPEPSTALLVALGAFCVAAYARKKRG